jgi:hypothetical protein
MYHLATLLGERQLGAVKPIFKCKTNSKVWTLVNTEQALGINWLSGGERKVGTKRLIVDF